jgi:membrane-bound ClpP family serine protease
MESNKQKILKLTVLGAIVTILGITAFVATGIGYSGIGLTVVGVISDSIDAVNNVCYCIS